MALYSKTFTYAGTGAQTEVTGYNNYGIKPGGTVACGGGSSDVYVIEEKIGGTWYPSITHSTGDIVPTRILGSNDAMRLNITTNTSGAITFSITS